MTAVSGRCARSKILQIESVGDIALAIESQSRFDPEGSSLRHLTLQKSSSVVLYKVMGINSMERIPKPRAMCHS